MENSIELFNCSICSFCETSLDRLVKHIRQHIKPEAKSLTNFADDVEVVKTQTTSQQQPVELKELHLDDYINNLSTSKVPPTSINLFTSAAINDVQSSSSQPSSSNRHITHSPEHSTIKVVNPQSISFNDPNQRNLPSLMTHPPAQQYQQPVRSMEGQATQQQMQISPPHLQQQPPPPPPPHTMMYIRKDAPKYVQIHPREHFSGNAPYVHPQQYKAYVHEQYVPIAPAKVTNFPDGKIVQPMDVHEAYHRSAHHHQQHRNIVPMKVHPNHPDVHANYGTRSNIHSAQQQQQQQQQYNVHSPTQRNAIQFQQQRVPMADYHLQNRVQSRINGMQHLDPNVGFPNNGTILLNPEQLLRMSGNTTSMDQLAGLLVVPLKKTMEIAVQTDPVEIGGCAKNSDNTISSGAQTDLRMQYILEETRNTPAPVFGQIRSTNTLFECLICGDEFVNDQHLQSHMSTMHKHVCENCFHASMSLQEHNAHVTECGNCGAELLCMDCNSLFPSIKKLNQHRIKIHSTKMPFRCGICNQPFETHDAVMQHMVTHDNDIPEFKCRYCTKVFQSADALGKHFQRHKMVDIEHQCNICKKSFNTDKLLRDHMSVAHVVRDTNTTGSSYNQMYQTDRKTNKQASSLNNSSGHTNVNKKYCLCKYCDLAFKNKELLSRHVKICSKNGSPGVTCFVCDVCKEFFESDNLRKVHLKHDHRRQNGYRCPKCSKVYRTWTRLKFHTKQQHVKKNCPDCNTVFIKEHILRKHQEDVHGKTITQNGDRTYKCSDCNLSLYTLTDLTMHRRTMHPDSTKSKSVDLSSDATMLTFLDNNPMHDASKTDDVVSNDQELPSSLDIDVKENNTQFTCERCNSTFEDEKRLKNHLGLTHGERPFVCEICNKRFQYSSQIVWHMKNHDNRPTKSISKTSNSLWKAKTTLVSKLKPKKSTLSLMNHVCQFCGARFKQEKLLKNHKGSVHKIKLFACYICGGKHGHSTELIWHVRTCKLKFLRENPGVDLPSQDAVQPPIEEPPVESIVQLEQTDNQESTNPNKSPESQFNNDLNETDDVDMPSMNIQLSKEEAEELLQNDPEYDHSRREYTCPLCKKTTKSITGMKTHYGRVHGIWSKESSHKFANGQRITIWPCRNCDKEFNSFEDIQQHCLDLHGLTVTKEELDFETRHEFIKRVQEQSLYTCQTCGMSFDNSKSIRVHTFKKHGILLNDVSLNECRNTDASIVTTTKLSPKTKSEIPQNPDDITEDELRFQCSKCKSHFRTMKALRAHSYKKHGTILSKQEMNKSKKWVATDVTTPDHSTSSSYNSSKGSDLIQSPNPCDRCGRVFGNYRAFFTHYRQAHRISDRNRIFVPRKPSRTELSIQSFVEPSSLSENTTPTTSTGESQPISSKLNTPIPNPEVADSVDCPKCARVFTNHKSFVAHLYSAHKVSKDQYSLYWPNGIPILPRESSMCPTCNKECLDERAMRIHMFKAHGTHYRDFANDQEVNKSSGVDKTEGMVTMLNEPLLDTIEPTEEIKAEPLPVCSICSRVCKNNRSLISHEFSAHGIRKDPNKRAAPNGIANTSTAMTNGNVINTSTPTSTPFICPVCYASYRNRRAITTHLCRVHRYKKNGVQAYLRKHFEENSIIATSLSETPDNPVVHPPLDETDGDGDKHANDNGIQDDNNIITNHPLDIVESCGEGDMESRLIEENDNETGKSDENLDNVDVNGDPLLPSDVNDDASLLPEDVIDDSPLAKDVNGDSLLAKDEDSDSLLDEDVNGDSLHGEDTNGDSLLVEDVNDRSLRAEDTNGDSFLVEDSILEEPSDLMIDDTEFDEINGDNGVDDASLDFDLNENVASIDDNQPPITDNESDNAPSVDGMLPIAIN